MSKADDLFMDCLVKEPLFKRGITDLVPTYIFTNSSTALIEKEA
jgi:hypothetical protein